MPRNTSVTIGPHFASFIERQIEKGQFASAGEAVRAALRLLEEREMKMDALRQALKAGENSGFVEYSLSGIAKELDRKAAE